MSEQATGTTESPAPDPRLTFALAAVLVAGFAARAQISLLPDFLTGDDGAYYLVQARAILRDGRIPIPDFPLVFYAQAALAWLLSLVMERNAAIVAAVRWTDAVVPLLLVVPVYLFVREFARRAAGRRGPVLAMIFAGLVATASGNALWTAGGTIKNGCALPFSLLFLYHLCRALDGGGRRSAALAVVFLLVSSLTHVSALALNAALVVLVVAASLPEPPVRARALRPALALTAALAGAVGVALLLDPDRAWRFLGVLAHPGRFFAGVPSLAPIRAATQSRFEAVFTLPSVWMGNALGLIGAYALWRHRAGADGATRVVLWATTVATLLFSFPLLAPDLLERLAAVAFVPGLVPLAFLLCRDASATVVVAPLVALSVLAGALTVKTARVTSLVRPAYEELAGFRAALPPGRSIVIARHGLEWWAVWTMDVHFSNWAGRALADRDRYDAVLLLEQTGPGAFGQRAPLPAPATPGASIRDGAMLRSEVITTLAEGEYFRLSRVGGP